MGNQEFHEFSRKDVGVRACANVLVVASPQAIAQADWLADCDALPGLVLHPCGPTDPVPPSLARAAELVVVEVDPDNRQSLYRVKELKLAAPALPIVAAISNASIALVRNLVREGVADVVSLPFQFEELLESTADALASAKRQAEPTRLSPMLAVVRSTGGSGATSVATHLGAELAAAGSKVAIVDLDLQMGNVANYLTCEGRGTITDLIEAEDRLDEALVESVARHFSDRLDVFAAPESIVPLESIDADDLLRALTQLRRQYDHVILDLPANWTSWTLSAAAAADNVLLVVELSIPSLRQARRLLELFDTVGIAPRKIEVVANRVEKRLFKTIDLDDVSRTLGRDAVGSLAVEDQVLGSAQDQGVLAQQIYRKSKFAADISKLAQHLTRRADS